MSYARLFFVRDVIVDVVCAVAFRFECHIAVAGYARAVVVILLSMHHGDPSLSGMKVSGGGGRKRKREGEDDVRSGAPPFRFLSPCFLVYFLASPRLVSYVFCFGFFFREISRNLWKCPQIDVFSCFNRIRFVSQRTTPAAKARRLTRQTRTVCYGYHFLAPIPVVFFVLFLVEID